MTINFNHAKKVAAGCLAMTSCAFFLWVNQNGIQADATAQEPTVTQTSAEQTTPVESNVGVESPSQQSINTADHGNYANLDQAQVTDSGQLNVTGWHATNASQGKNYHYIIALNAANNQEIGRQNITDQEVSRPDVARVFPVYGAGNSGFSTSFDLGSKLANLSRVQIVSRYTDDPAGNGNAIDYWFAPITIDRSNLAHIDGITSEDGQLVLNGWHATNLAADKPNHFIIIFDQTLGHEVARGQVGPVARPDVAKAFAGIDGAGQSGFVARIPLSKLNLRHQLQVISRYTSSADGNSDYVDYWFNSFTSTNPGNLGHLDNVDLSNGKQMVVTGWHASDLARLENNQFLILFDLTNNRQVAVVKAQTAARPDVARAFANIDGAGQSGFQGSFDLTSARLDPAHQYAVVSRLSTSNQGNGDQGQYTDFWSAQIKLTQHTLGHLDQIAMTKDGLQIGGWMISDQSLIYRHPYAIVLNDGKEIARKALTLTNRPDIKRIYGGVYNSANSGFSALIPLDLSKATGNVQVILRFTDDPAGNGNYDDYYTQAYATDAGWFDNIQVNGTSLYVSGWHTSNQAINKPYQYLIFIDQSGKEVYRQEVLDKNRARPDIAKLYPATYNSGNSGFQLGFTIPDSLKKAGIVRIIHRYTDDAAGNGNFTDYWSGPVSVGLMRTPIDYTQPSEYAPYPNLSQLSNFWIHVRIGQNRVYLMNGNDVVYTMYCTAGYYDHGVSTTPTGTFYIQRERGNSFYNASLGEGANYWTSFLYHGVYLFHTVPTDASGHYKAYEASQLGINQGSHGCIRLSVPDAYWIMHNVPTGTKVVIDN